MAHYLNVHYVRTGKLERETNRRYAALQRFRESADYQVGVSIDLQAAQLAVSDAAAFVELCEKLIEEILDSLPAST